MASYGQTSSSAVVYSYGLIQLWPYIVMALCSYGPDLVKLRAQRRTLGRGRPLDPPLRRPSTKQFCNHGPGLERILARVGPATRIDFGWSWRKEIYSYGLIWLLRRDI